LLREFLDVTAEKPSQRIVTTHESNLLSLDLLRRDEVWFTQKNKQGVSSLYSLEEFKTRFDKDIRKGYLVGRFGGVPVLKHRVMDMSNVSGA
jgi:AAA15 family ATPase/GTPase